MAMKPHPGPRERFRKRLVWLYAITLMGVLTLLAAAIFPDQLAQVRSLGVALTLLGALSQLWATWDYARTR
jgi:uncharacterized membrane protein